MSNKTIVLALEAALTAVEFTETDAVKTITEPGGFQVTDILQHLIERFKQEDIAD